MYHAAALATRSAYEAPSTSLGIPDSMELQTWRQNGAGRHLGYTRPQYAALVGQYKGSSQEEADSFQLEYGRVEATRGQL